MSRAKNNSEASPASDATHGSGAASARATGSALQNPIRQMKTNKKSYRVRTPDGKEVYLRCESFDSEAAADAARLLGVEDTTLEVTDDKGKVQFFSLKLS